MRGIRPGNNGEPADEVDIVGGDLGEGFGGFVGFEAQVTDDFEDFLGLVGGVLEAFHGGAEGSDGALGVGGVEGVDCSVDLVLGHGWGSVGADDFGGSDQGWGDSGFEVGFVSQEVPLVVNIGAGGLPGAERSAVGFVVENARRVESVAGAGAVEAGEGVCYRGAIVIGTDVAEEGLFPICYPDAEHVAGFGDARGGDGHSGS